MTTKGYLILFGALLLLRLIFPQTVEKLWHAPFKFLARFNLNAADILIGALVSLAAAVAAAFVGGLLVVALSQLPLAWVQEHGFVTVAWLSPTIGYGAFGRYLVRTSRARAIERSMQGS